MRKNERKYKNNYWFSSDNLYSYGHLEFDWNEFILKIRSYN